MSRPAVCVMVIALLHAETFAAPRAWSLEEAKQQALERNPTLGRAARSLDESTATLEVFDASYATQLAIDATGRAERLQPRRSPFAQSLARDEATISVALTRVFPSGAEARFGVALTRALSTTRAPSQLGHEDVEERTVAPRLEASLRQPLWGGRRIGAATAAQLSTTRRAIGFDLDAARCATLREVTRAYWQLYLAQREVVIRGEARGAAEAQLRKIEAEIARGARPRLAAIEIDDALARLREDELVAIGAVGERSVDLSRAIGIAPTTELRAGDVPDDLEIPTRGRLDLAPRLIASEARIQTARAELERTGDEARWRIDGVVSASLEAPRDRLRAAIDATASYGGWVVEVGLVVRGPLSDRGPVAKRAGARARLQAAELARREVEGEIAAEVERLANRRDTARARRIALIRAVDLAEQNMRAERNRWERGDTTAFELLRRQATVGETQLRLERARIDELEADAAIAAVYGVLRS